MAFNINLFQKWSQGDAVGVNNQWAYFTSTDAIATIVTDGYFNSVNNITPDGVSASPLIRVNDLIWVVCTDYEGFVLVTALDPNIVTDQFQITIGAGSVGTANLANGAVTAAKLATDSVTTVKILAGNVTNAKIDPSVIQSVSVNITAAQFNGMYAAPIALLAAGGANTLIVLDSVTLEVNYGAAQFAAGGVIAAQYDSTVHGAGVAASGTIAAATAQGWAADSVVAMQGLLGSATAAATVNKGIYLSNATGAFTTGDSTLVAHIRYAVLPTTF